MAAKRNIITYNDTAAEAICTIIGISSHENDYRLSWSINENLGLAFTRENDNIEAGNGREFSRFTHEDEEQCLTLVSNRCDNGFLIEKLKNLDFILKFDSELNEEETEEWLKKLRKVTLISAAFEIEGNKKIMNLLR